MRIGIMLPEFNVHDAVGNDALGMYLILKSQGHDCFIFTRHGRTGHPLAIYRYQDIPILFTSPDDLIIYHYCVADGEGLNILRRGSARVILRYHNVTPASFMMPYSKDFATGAKYGREMLLQFADVPLIGILNASNYNANDLKSIIPSGVPMAMLPPLHNTDELLGMPDDPHTHRLISAHWFNIVTVGRIVPNKALEIMLEHFASVLENGLAGLHLHFVGGRDPRLASYWQRLDAIVENRNLGASVTWHNSLSATGLATLYRHCDLFWTSSQHEGFCVPVVEAMGFGLPVMSTRKAALPETCGNAAIFSDHLTETIRNMRQIVTDDVFRVKLGQAGSRRYQAEFSLSNLQRGLLAHIDMFCEHDRKNIDWEAIPIDNDWFGVPNSETIVREALLVRGNSNQTAIAGSDRRRKLLDWIIREGHKHSPSLKAALQSAEFLTYAKDISVPSAASHLTAAMKLAWNFNIEARTSFSLQTHSDIGQFLRWYEAFAKKAYEAVLFSPQTLHVE